MQKVSQHKSASSSNIVDEVFKSFLIDKLENSIKLRSLVVIVVLLELRPLSLRLLFVFLHGQVVKLLWKLTPLDKLLHLCCILLLHALGVSGVLSL
jgi:hypothetical protein